MTHITMTNFGKHYGTSYALLENQHAHNGWGKTTLVNAYKWCLDGKTIDGFVARNSYANDEEYTSVIIEGFFGHKIERIYDHVNKANKITLDGMPVTQTEMYAALDVQGVDVPFAALCADANKLTSPSLDSADLRTFLTKVDLMDNDERSEVEKKLKGVRTLLKQAEAFSLNVVSIPAQTCQPPTPSDMDFKGEYEANLKHAQQELRDTCPVCGQSLPPEDVDKLRRHKESAVANTTNANCIARYEALVLQQKQFDDEQSAISRARQILAQTTKAREDVLTYTKQVEDLQKRLIEIDKEAVKYALPEDVEIRMEAEGKAKSVCALYYREIPLRSVNRAKRIDLCVQMLDTTRTRKGMQNAPIIIDNAETISTPLRVSNVIRLTVSGHINNIHV